MKTTTSAKQDQKERLKQNEEKWTAPLMAAGWTAVPSVILERQQALGLDAVDVNILLQIAKHWWYSERLPYPSKRAIAEAIGVDPSTVQRHIRELEKAGLIKREKRVKVHGGQDTNAYNFQGLIREATPYALEAIADRQARIQERAARRTRKRPQLVYSRNTGVRGNAE